MAHQFDGKNWKELLIPVAKLGSICAGVALALALVNLITAPVIAEANLREKNLVLDQLSGGAARGEERAAYPLEMGQAAWQAMETDPGLSFSERSVMERCYALKDDGVYHLIPGLNEKDAAALSAVSAQSAINRKGRVRTWYVLTKGSDITGYVCELTGAGYGGPIDIIAAYAPDGTVRSFRVLRASESPAQSKQIRSDDYDRHFIGTRGNGVPVVKAMLSRASADAVSGASISFMAVAATIKDGSLFIMARGGA